GVRAKLPWIEATRRRRDHTPPPRELPASRHLELHLERRHEEHRRSIHVRDDVLDVLAPRLVEARVDRPPRSPVDAALDRPEEPDLRLVLPARYELLEMTEIVQRERQPICMRRRARVVVEKRHAPSPARLQRQHVARRRHVEEEHHVALSPPPRDER